MDKIVTTRQFLREFASIKEALLLSEVQAVYVSAGKGKKLKITIEEEKTPFQKALEIIQNNDFSKIERPELDLFSEE